MNTVEGKVAIITGGGRGIGRASSELLAKNGAKVVITDIDLDVAQEAASNITGLGGEAIAIEHDIASENQWNVVFKNAVINFGKLDILVNNAGLALPGSCEDTSWEDWQRVIDVTLSGAFLGMRGAIKLMKTNTAESSIINISSGYGLIGGGAVSYSTAKGGLGMLTKSAVVECGRLGYNIRINTIYPGAIGDTRLGRIHEDDEKNQIATAEYAKKIPMGRLGRADEIAKGVLFLASDDSSYMTGSALVMDGGYTAA